MSYLYTDWSDCKWCLWLEHDVVIGTWEYSEEKGPLAHCIHADHKIPIYTNPIYQPSAHSLLFCGVSSANLNTS